LTEQYAGLETQKHEAALSTDKSLLTMEHKIVVATDETQKWTDNNFLLA
jgi:hypothetical protein